MGSTAEGRHAVVTGAGRGIGAAITNALAAAGMRITLMGRDLDVLESTAAALDQTRCTAMDVTDPAKVSDAFDRARTDFGPVDVLVNNAGAALSNPYLKLDDKDWHQCLEVNLLGADHCIQAVLPDMLASNRGRVINIASTAALRGYAYVAPYVAAKHALLGLTRPTDVAAVDAHYRAYVLLNHPDKGGSHDAMVKGNLARAILLACSEEELKTQRTVAARHSSYLSDREVAFYTAYVEEVLRTQRPQHGGDLYLHPSGCACVECAEMRRRYDLPYSQEKFDAWLKSDRRGSRRKRVILLAIAAVLAVAAMFALWPVESYGDGLVYDLKWRTDVATEDALQRLSDTFGP